jgi:hypothetical protein
VAGRRPQVMRFCVQANARAGRGASDGFSYSSGASAHPRTLTRLTCYEGRSAARPGCVRVGTGCPRRRATVRAMVGGTDYAKQRCGGGRMRRSQLKGSGRSLGDAELSQGGSCSRSGRSSS